MIILPKKSGIVLSMFAALNFSLNAYGDERLKLVPGELVTVKIDEDAKSIVGFVANPDIADAYLGLKDTFVFVGKRSEPLISLQLIMIRDKSNIKYN